MSVTTGRLWVLKSVFVCLLQGICKHWIDIISFSWWVCSEDRKSLFFARRLSILNTLSYSVFANWMANRLAVWNKIVRYTQSLCQTRICTADRALTPLACTITVVLLRCFMCYEMQLLQRASRNPHGSLYIYIYIYIYNCIPFLSVFCLLYRESYREH